MLEAVSKTQAQCILIVHLKVLKETPMLYPHDVDRHSPSPLNCFLVRKLAKITQTFSSWHLSLADALSLIIVFTFHLGSDSFPPASHTIRHWVAGSRFSLIANLCGEFLYVAATQTTNASQHPTLDQ